MAEFLLRSGAACIGWYTSAVILVQGESAHGVGMLASTPKSIDE
jgi:hypothetical protein